MASERRGWRSLLARLWVGPEPLCCPCAIGLPAAVPRVKTLVGDEIEEPHVMGYGIRRVTSSV